MFGLVVYLNQKKTAEKKLSPQKNTSQQKTFFLLAGYNYFDGAAFLFFMVSGLVTSIESVFNGGKESVTTFSISVEGSAFLVSLFSQAMNKVDAMKINANQRCGCDFLNSCCIDLVFNVP